MAKRRRWFPRLLILIALLATPILIAPLLPLDSLKPEVESRLSAVLGRKVTVGSMRLSLLGGPYLHITDMVAHEDPAFGDGNFLVAPSVRANLAVIPLIFRRQVVLDAAEIISPEITLTRNGKGVWNWTTLGQPIAGPPAVSRLGNGWSWLWLLALQSGPATPLIDELQIQRASVRVMDKAAPQLPETIYKNVDLRVSLSKQGTASHAVGRLGARSEDHASDGSLNIDMPFDLLIDQPAGQPIAAKGSLGPGPLETRNFAADSFRSALDFRDGTARLDEMEITLYEGSLRGRFELDLKGQRFKYTGQIDNLNLDKAFGRSWQKPGQLTGHLTSTLELGGALLGFQRSLATLSGAGRMSSNDLFVTGMNLSERVASRLKIDQIGDMSPGTSIGHFETDFHIDQGVIKTDSVTLQQIDGLGDASASGGWVTLGPEPALSYAASVLLSSEATARVKSSSPLIGILVSIFETNNRISVPVNVTGEMRNPQVQVDITGRF